MTKPFRPHQLEPLDDSGDPVADGAYGLEVSGGQVTGLVLGGAGVNATGTAVSASSVAIGTGSKTFALTAMPVAFGIGAVVKVTDDAAPNTNYMVGDVTAATTTSVTINVTEIGGSGTKTAWHLNVGAYKGAAGSPGAGGASRPGIKSGQWQNTSLDFTGTSSAAGTVGQLFLQPLIVAFACTLDRIGLNTVTTGTGVARLGIYNDSSGFPGALLLDAGTVSNATTTGEKSITINQALSVGIYWLASLTESSNGTWRYHDTNPGLHLLGRGSGIEGSFNTAYAATGLSAGSLPSTPTLAISQGAAPRVAVRFA